MKAKKPVLHECRNSSCSYSSRSKVSWTYFVRDSACLFRPVFFAFCAPAGGGSEAPPLKLQNRSSYGRQNYTHQWTHHFQLLGITWLTQWRCLKSLLRHSVEFTDTVQISLKVGIKYLNSKVSDKTRKLANNKWSLTIAVMVRWRHYYLERNWKHSPPWISSFELFKSIPFYLKLNRGIF